MTSDHGFRAKALGLLAPCHVASFARILLVVALLLTNIALAQPAKKTNQESGAESYETINKARDIGFKCAEAVARVKDIKHQIQAWEIVNDKFIGPLGDALTIIKAGTELSQGQPEEAVQTAGEALIDSAVCNARKDLCPAWVIGRTVGDLINMAPKLFGSDRTVNDVWTDLLAGWAYPDPTPADLQKLFDLARQKQRELRALMESQQREKVRCEASEDALDNAIKDAAALVGQRATQRALHQGQQSPSALQQQGLGERAGQQGDAFSNAASGVLQDAVRQSVQRGVSDIQTSRPSEQQSPGYGTPSSAPRHTTSSSAPRHTTPSSNTPGRPLECSGYVCR